MALSGNRRLGGVVKVGRCCQGREVLSGWGGVVRLRNPLHPFDPGLTVVDQPPVCTRRLSDQFSVAATAFGRLEAHRLGVQRRRSYRSQIAGHRSQVTGHRSQVTGATGHRCDRSQAAGADDLRGMYACISVNGGSLPAAAGRLIPGEGTGKPLRRVWHVWQILAFHGGREAIRFSLPPVPLPSIFGGMPFP